MSALDDKTVSRFWAKVNRDGPVHPTLGTPCWLWTACVHPEGYGHFKKSRKLGTGWAHRIAWELLRGPIPQGLTIDHLCRVRRCVNPAHLDPVTNVENIRRGAVGRHNATKTHCPKGHPYAGGNLLLWRGTRTCAECHRRASRARYARQKRASEGRGEGLPPPGGQDPTGFGTLTPANQATLT